MTVDVERSVDRSAVSVCECWSRDGIQPWAGVVPAAVKIKTLRALARAGVTEVDLTAFSPTEQFSDRVEILYAAYSEHLFDKVRVLAINLRGIRDLAEIDKPSELVNTCGFPISASESHNRANLRRSTTARRAEIEEMVGACVELEVEPLLCIATAFGCPIEGDVPAGRVEEMAEWAAEIGVRRLMLGDTTGMGCPPQVGALFRRIGERCPQVELIAHLHDTRGTGMANAFAALAAGVRSFDTSLGGTGGEPAGIIPDQKGATGNLCTEDFVAALTRSGYTTGIDPELLLDAGSLAEAAFGAPLRSQVLRAGL